MTVLGSSVSDLARAEPETRAAPPSVAEAAEPSAGEGIRFPVETFRLDNGMEVAVLENHRAPVVYSMVWYRVGAADEQPGQSGLAHFLEHLMFKGTERLKPGQFSRRIAELGGNDNAFTSWDYTAYHETVAKAALDDVLGMEADRMVNLRLTDEIVLPERSVVLEERRMRSETEPGDRLTEAAYAALFTHHPYGTPIIGWRHEIAQMGRAEALAFYKRWYAPNNAFLVVAGDVTVAEVKQLAAKHFGRVPKADTPPRLRPQEPDLTVPRRLVLEDEDVRQPQLAVYWLADGFRTAAAKDAGQGREAYTLEVLSEVISGGQSARLSRALVLADGAVASDAGASYDGLAWDRPAFIAYAIPRPGADDAEVERRLLAELKRIGEDGVSAAELTTARNRLIASFEISADGLTWNAGLVGRAWATGVSVETIRSYPQAIATVTAAEVQAAAKALFATAPAVTAWLKPLPGQPVDPDAPVQPLAPAGRTD